MKKFWRLWIRYDVKRNKIEGKLLKRKIVLKGEVVLGNFKFRGVDRREWSLVIRRGVIWGLGFRVVRLVSFFFFLR